MLIDWFTVIAQVINFLILVWLLKRFLYKPILDAIDAREKRIARELADADAKKADALKEREEFQRKKDEFDRQRSERMNQVDAEAQEERTRMLKSARQEADELRSRLKQTLRTEQQSLKEALAHRTREEVFAIARKALTDLAGISLEERLVDIFIQRLRGMDEQVRSGLGKSLGSAAEPALLRSVLDLPEAQRAAIQQALNETFSADINLRFETAPELISGIELTTNGQKLAWSIADYLVSLEEGVDELLKNSDKSDPLSRKSPVTAPKVDA